MKKMTKDELIKRDQGRNIGEEALQAIRDIKAGKVRRIWRSEREGATVQVLAEMPPNDA